MLRRVAVFVVLLTCALAHAAGADTQFLLLMGRDTVAVERFTATDARWQGALLVHSAGIRMDWTLAIDAAADAGRGRPTDFGIRVRRVAAPDTAPPMQQARFEFAGDTVRVAGSAGKPQAWGGMRGAWPFVNPSMAMLARAIRGVRPAPGDSAIVTLATLQGGHTMAATVRALGRDSVSVEMARVELRFALGPHGEVTGGVVPAQGLRLEASTVEGPLAMVPAAPPDYSAPAGAPYTADEVRVSVPGGYALAGTLTRPAHAPGPVPCVVTITGSGLEDRDESIPLVRGYRPFRQFADAFARRGIATLRLDDRGFGGSGGDPSQATSEGFADDVRAALAWLRARPDIDARHLVLMGHSEGGLIAPMVAADDPAVSAIVLLAAPARTGRTVIAEQQRQAVAHVEGLDAAGREARQREMMVQADSLAARTPWLRFFLAYDPLPAARRVRVPVLLLQGANDRQVSAAQAGELAAAMRAGGNRDVTVRVLPGVNHLFLDDPDGDPSGYAHLAAREIRPDVLALVTDWLAARVAVPARRR